VPVSLLPEDDAERDQFLQSYFCELLAVAHREKNEWVLRVGRPPSAEFYIDPTLEIGLDWWRRDISEISIAALPFAYERRHGFQLSFSDAWTAFSWCEWAQRDPKVRNRPLTILHADDHRDLMSPRIIRGEAGLIDLMTRAEIDFTVPASVACAIRSGAIGMGSFFAPMLGVFPGVHVRHLRNSSELTTVGPVPLRPTYLLDTLLEYGAVRPAVERGTNSLESDAGLVDSYRVTENMSDWLADLPDHSIVLHVDMDFFNNRFDGDSNRVLRDHKYDPPISFVIEQIDELFVALERSRTASRIRDCSISLSPGFFPGELWEPCITRVEGHIRRLVQAGSWSSG
jgi:hypothetical protein